MNKMKKMIALVLVIALCCTISVGITVAYLTRTDSDVNVMTLGEVKIQQNEQQRVEENGEFTSELEAFEQGKILRPVTYPGDRTADKVTIGGYEITLSDDEANYVDKIVSVTNTGSEDAYIRTLVAVPTGGADWESTPVAAKDCWLHWNIPTEYANYWTLVGTNVPMIEIDGESYYVWEFIHKDIVEPKETTYPMVRGFYMDSRVDHDDNGYYMNYADGTTKRIEDVAFGDTVEVRVLSQAVQAAGFSEANTALDAGFGDVTVENATAWFNNMAAPAVAASADDLVAALEKGEDVILTESVKIDPANMSNAYGTTGINIKNGQTLDGCGNTLDITGAGGTWDSGINTTGGTIKNITVTGAFRGIFINHNSTHSEPVILENVTIDGTTYTISCDQGTNQTLTATNCTFNGWTSYAATLGEATFIDCSFGEGNGYAYCRPYAPTTFVGCDFEAGFEVDPRAAVTFENCTIGGVALTADNLATLVTSNIATATVK